MPRSLASIIGIIPARYASSRFPGKMLAPLAGKTVIQHTWENAARIALLDELIVATDDEKIFAHVTAFGGRAVMTSRNCATGTDRIAEVVRSLPHLQKAALVLNIQGDDPFLSEETVAKTAHHLCSKPSAPVGTAVCPLTDPKEAKDPSIVKCVLDGQGNALYFSRNLLPAGHTQSMQTDVAYYRHIGLYLYRPSFLLKYSKLKPTPLQLAEDLEQLKILEHGYRIRASVVSSQAKIHINTPEDIVRAEEYLCQQNTSSLPEAFAPL